MIIESGSFHHVRFVSNDSWLGRDIIVSSTDRMQRVSARPL